jgi:hypothetical protein
MDEGSRSCTGDEDDEEATGTLAAIEGDEQEDGPESVDGGEGGDLLGDSRASKR